MPHHLCLTLSLATIASIVYFSFSLYRSMWVHPILKERDSNSEFILADAVLEGDLEKCIQYFRISKEKFFWLLAMLEPKIKKSDSNWRKAISPKQRLIVTLRFVLYNLSFFSMCS